MRLFQFNWLIPKMLMLSFLGSVALGADEGFTPIFDREHLDGWKQCGPGQLKVQDGVGTTSTPNRRGLYWYAKRKFADFTIKLEFMVDGPKSNSGILLRFPDPGNEPEIAEKKGYEVEIFGEKTGSITHIHPAKPAAVKAGAWNTYEITAVSQKYTVRLNGELVNTFTGDRGLEGYVGLQVMREQGDVHFRNIRIKEIPALAKTNTPVPPKVPELFATSQIKTLADQAPNASAWATAPLDVDVPIDIRENLLALKEDLLDEARRNSQASQLAYDWGTRVCTQLITALDERTQTQVRAGASRTVQKTTTLGARRKDHPDWPDYIRETKESEERRKQNAKASLTMDTHAQVVWTERAAQLRKGIDATYAQFREALRQNSKPRQ